MIPTLRTLGNLITGSDQQTNEVLKAGALDKFFSLLNHEKRAVRREACWTLSNITAGDEEQISLVTNNPAYIEKLIALINSDSPEVSFTKFFKFLMFFLLDQKRSSMGDFKCNKQRKLQRYLQNGRIWCFGRFLSIAFL